MQVDVNMMLTLLPKSGLIYTILYIFNILIKNKPEQWAFEICFSFRITTAISDT